MGSYYLAREQGRLRSRRHQQGWRLGLQQELPRWSEQDQHQRLPCPCGNVPRVAHPLLTILQHQPRIKTRKLTLLPSVHAITARLNPLQSRTPREPGSRPEPPSGLEVLESENFRMQCFNTLTGTKFLLFTDTTQTNLDVTMRRVYDLYSDYVMKNPFYSLEMPIRCDIFDRKLLSYIREINNR